MYHNDPKTEHSCSSDTQLDLSEISLRSPSGITLISDDEAVQLGSKPQSDRDYIKKLLNSGTEVVIGTHNGDSHLDDQAAAAVLSLAFGDKALFCRTRDKQTLEHCHILKDVGLEYNPLTARYDHHQRTDGPPMRAEGIERSSLGAVAMDEDLMAQAYSNVLGRTLDSAECKAITRYLDKSIIQYIDAGDVGDLEVIGPKINGDPFFLKDINLPQDKQLSPDAHYAAAAQNFREAIAILILAADNNLNTRDGFKKLHEFLADHPMSTDLKTEMLLASEQLSNPNVQYTPHGGTLNSKAHKENATEVHFDFPTLVHLGALALQTEQGTELYEIFLARQLATDAVITRQIEKLSEEVLVPAFEQPLMEGVAFTNVQVSRADLRRVQDYYPNVHFVVYPDKAESWRVEMTGEYRITDELATDDALQFCHNKRFVARLRDELGPGDALEFAQKCLKAHRPGSASETELNAAKEQVKGVKIEDPLDVIRRPNF